jgi:uncharacterized membrane protein YeaQ/YmgE (transglycosylase-associated protein family)
MPTHSLIAWIAIGIVAGWLAGRVVEGSGFGLLGDLVVGLAGAVVGGAIFRAVDPNVAYRGLWSVVVAFVGAVLLLALLRLLSGGRGLGGVRRRHFRSGRPW